MRIDAATASRLSKEALVNSYQRKNTSHEDLWKAKAPIIEEQIKKMAETGSFSAAISIFSFSDTHNPWMAANYFISRLKEKGFDAYTYLSNYTNEFIATITWQTKQEETNEE